MGPTVLRRSQPRVSGPPGKRWVYAAAEPGASGGVGTRVHVIEILLPLQRRDGSPQPRALFGATRSELVERFGGLTAFTRAPAEGLWEREEGAVESDSIVVFEVMADELDRGWWAAFKARLEQSFDQDEIVIRAAAAERL